LFFFLKTFHPPKVHPWWWKWPSYHYPSFNLPSDFLRKNLKTNPWVLWKGAWQQLDYGLCINKWFPKLCWLLWGCKDIFPLSYHNNFPLSYFN
jgi:hypothetical protein